MKGIIARYYEDKGFGFIKETSGREIFFYFTKVMSEEEIKVGMEVEYQYGRNSKGIVAEKIVILKKNKVNNETFEPKNKLDLIGNNDFPKGLLVKDKPIIAILGRTGSGKSSLCNALAGSDICNTNDVASCTKEPQVVDMLIQKEKQIQLIDVPGFGKSILNDDECEELYKEIVPNVNMILWLLKADERTFSSDERLYNNIIIRKHTNKSIPFFLVVNQVDKIEPFREWNMETNMPSLMQLQNIGYKCSEVSRVFKLPFSRIVPVSAKEDYNISRLVEEIDFVLSNEMIHVNIEERSIEAEPFADVTDKEPEKSETEDKNKDKLVYRLFGREITIQTQ